MQAGHIMQLLQGTYIIDHTLNTSFCVNLNEVTNIGPGSLLTHLT